MLFQSTPEALASFAAERDSELTKLATRIAPEIKDALGKPDFVDQILQSLRNDWLQIYLSEDGNPRQAQRKWQEFQLELLDSLKKTSPKHDDAQVERISTWLATATLNGATTAAAPARSTKRWISMRDSHVREWHVEADSQTVPIKSKFRVCNGVEVDYPGQPVGPPACFLGCRCITAILPAVEASSEEEIFMSETAVLAKEYIVPADEAESDDMGTVDSKATTREECEAAGGYWVVDDKETGEGHCEEPDSEPTDEEMAAELGDLDLSPVPWHGILLVEGTETGDGRKFAEGAITWRDTPLPLSWQKTSGNGHDGSVVVGRIENITRDGNQILGDGVFLDSEFSDEVIGLIAEQALRGISVDVDAAEMTVEETEMADVGKTLFSKGRISGATIVPVAAFAEAVIRLGPKGDQEAAGHTEEFKEYDTEQRKKMAKNGQAMPDGSFPIADCEDLANAVHAIGRASDPDAAKAHIKKRAKALGGCGIEISFAEDVETFQPSGPGDKRGPGWVTAPAATRRIHRYWTKGEGAAKIGWGAPGDFNRCRRQLAKYVGPRFLNRTCAEWHHDALGYWPATHAKMEGRGRHSAETVDCGCAVTLVAATGPVLDSALFADPGLTRPTPITVAGDRVYGHLATWGTCHIGMSGTCVTPPRSKCDYGLFRTGVVETEAGEIPVGCLTMGTSHADLDLAVWATRNHYDHTGTVVADVVCGEDEHGIWFSGALRPDLTPERRREFLAGAISGDWRQMRGNLELVAALVVNTPGFPIPRTGLAASGGRQVSLVAAGLTPLAVPQITEIVRQVAKELRQQDFRAERARSLMRSVTADRVKALVAAVEGE